MANGLNEQKKEGRDYVVFTKNNLKKAVKYLLQNCYIKFWNKIFGQIIGISMGSEPAPFFASLFYFIMKADGFVN